MSERRMLVTGAGGFIGSHLTEYLASLGYRVRAMVRYASHGNAGFLDEMPENLKSRIEIIRGDITDSRCVREAMVGCETVYHLAALIGIPYSYVAPESYIDVNIRGTLNILEGARNTDVKRIVVTSTSEVYGTAQFTPITEEHPINAQSPYAATKVAADSLALSYHRAFGLPVTIVRPFNTFGPRQSVRAVIPTVITQALYRDTIQIGSRNPVRDMVYVADTARGFVKLAECDTCIGRATNLATNVGVTVGELVDRIQAIIGCNKPVVEAEERKRPEASEVFALLGTAEKATRDAGWRPEVDLNEGLKRAIEYFRQKTDNAQSGRYGI